MPQRPERIVNLRRGRVGKGFSAPATPLRRHALEQVFSRSRGLDAHLTDRLLAFAAAIATSRGTSPRRTPVLSCRHAAASMNSESTISSVLQVPISRFSTDRTPAAVGRVVALIGVFLGFRQGPDPATRDVPQVAAGAHDWRASGSSLSGHVPFPMAPYAHSQSGNQPEVSFADNPSRWINDWGFCGWQSPAWNPANFRIGRLGEWGSVGSMLIGGLSVVIADGSVRFVSEFLEITVRRSVSRTADGSVVGGNFESGHREDCGVSAEWMIRQRTQKEA
jgi:hypothetical protein